MKILFAITRFGNDEPLIFTESDLLGREGSDVMLNAKERSSLLLYQNKGMRNGVYCFSEPFCHEICLYPPKWKISRCWSPKETQEIDLSLNVRFTQAGTRASHGLCRHREKTCKLTERDQCFQVLSLELLYM